MTGPFVRPEPHPLPEPDNRQHEHGLGAALLAAVLGVLLILTTPERGPDWLTLLGWVLLAGGGGRLVWVASGWLHEWIDQ